MDDAETSDTMFLARDICEPHRATHHHPWQTLPLNIETFLVCLERERKRKPEDVEFGRGGQLSLIEEEGNNCLICCTNK